MSGLEIPSAQISTLLQQIKPGGVLETTFLKPARGNTFIYDYETKGFVQEKSRTDTFKSIDEIPSFLQRAPQTIGDAADANDADGEVPPPSPQAVEFVTSINLFELPFKKSMISFVLPMVLRAITKEHLHSLLFEENKTTTTGRLLCSEKGHSILFETPEDSVPYLYLSLKGVETAGIQRRWQAMLAYDEEGDWRKHSFEKLETYKYTHDVDPSTTKFGPFDAFACMIRDLVSQYIRVVQNEANAIMDDINRVEKSLEGSQALSKLLGQLNTISRTIRVSSLEKQFKFSIDAAKWANGALRPSSHTLVGSDLLLSARKMEKYHPDRLKEYVEHLRQRINEVAAEKQQDRDEQRHEREDKRQKEKDKRHVQEEVRREKREQERQEFEIERRELLERAEAQREEDRARADREWQLLERNTKIAVATLQDSRTMSGVAWVTMAFLPATFVSSFFGMNFFNGIAGKVPFDEASRSVWLFFAIAIPTSAFVLLTFYFWDKQEFKKDQQESTLHKLQRRNWDCQYSTAE
ncbi:uncharacterized protein J4E78_007191 [Alternaria triticimaculans]|uniref:uncharacterized protein n=1 Tax=Alternaria triticimaculans TaxID=297637 RepID=UPI0020C2F3A4|nr:uncharacterized protein J4E78_007191 [Alternaria triticimaculans]KAI4655011.1 hypothetical protein J4E78_007191 [Alternaria triticimaculans]